jgi:hypothetical protein
MAYRRIETQADMARFGGVLCLACPRCRARTFLTAHELQARHGVALREAEGRLDRLWLPCPPPCGSLRRARPYLPGFDTVGTRRPRTYGSAWTWDAPPAGL